MASALSESGSSGFSSLPTSQDGSMMEIQEDSPGITSTNEVSVPSCLEIVPFKPFSFAGSPAADDDDSEPCSKKTKLALDGKDDDKQRPRNESAEQLGTNPDKENSDSDFKIKTEESGMGEILTSFGSLAKQIQSFSDENPFEEFRKSLRTLTGHMEALSQQVRETQVLFLKSSINETPSMAPSSIEPPTRGIQMIRIKCEDEEIPIDVFRTPKKTDEQRSGTVRLDVTPISGFGGEIRNQAPVLDDPHHINISNILGGRRSLVFPKSLGDMLDKCADNDNGKLSKDAAIQTEELLFGIGNLQNYRTPKTIEPSPPLPISFMQIKKEPIDFEDSPSPPPHSRQSNMGLLVLADAANAMKQTHDEEKALKDLCSSESLRSESDSGRSTGGSYNGSPVMQSSQRSTLSLIPTEKFSFGHTQLDKAVLREGQVDGEQKTVMPQSPTGSSSSSSMMDSKTRKRRKVKDPLPCSFCGKFFSNQSSLRQHESFHRPMRPYKCEHEKCEKAYKTRSELNRHVVVHSGEKKHFCKLCGKKFLRKQYLKTHLLRHHETGITMVTPTAKGIDASCDPAIIMSAARNVPVAVVPSAFVSQTEPLTWRCQLCMKIFVNNEDLIKHVRSYHEKKRPAGTTSTAAKDEVKVENAGERQAS